MKRLAGTALSTLLLAIMTATPVSAAPVLPPCGGIGFGNHEKAVTPDFTPILGAVDHSFTIDLSEQEVPEGEEPITTADVNVVLSWTGSPVSDYDMTVNGTDVWNNDIPPVNSETFLIEDLEHCGTVDVTVWTYIGVPIDAVKLTLTVSA